MMKTTALLTLLASGTASTLRGLDQQRLMNNPKGFMGKPTAAADFYGGHGSTPDMSYATTFLENTAVTRGAGDDAGPGDDGTNDSTSGDSGMSGTSGDSGKNSGASNSGASGNSGATAATDTTSSDSGNNSGASNSGATAATDTTAVTDTAAATASGGEDAKIFADAKLDYAELKTKFAEETEKVEKRMNDDGTEMSADELDVVDAMGDDFEKELEELYKELEDDTTVGTEEKRRAKDAIDELAQTFFDAKEDLSNHKTKKSLDKMTEDFNMVSTALESHVKEGGTLDAKDAIIAEKDEELRQKDLEIEEKDAIIVNVRTKTEEIAHLTN